MTAAIDVLTSAEPSATGKSRPNAIFPMKSELEWAGARGEDGRALGEEGGLWVRVCFFGEDRWAFG